MSIEAMRQALEALEKNYVLINGTERFLGLDQIKDTYYAGCFDVDGVNEQTNGAITALRTAIEQAEKQENECGNGAGCLYKISLIEHLEEKLAEAEKRSVNAPRQWVGLTEDEIDDIWNQYCDEMGEASINDAEDIARAIEAKLKEKNA